MRSGLPSPFTSAAVTESGPLVRTGPVAKVCWAAKLGVAAPGAVVFRSTETVLPLVRDDEIGFAVAVHVRRRDRVGIGAGGEGLLGGEARGARPGRGGVQEHRDGVVP